MENIENINRNIPLDFFYLNSLTFLLKYFWEPQFF